MGCFAFIILNLRCDHLISGISLSKYAYKLNDYSKISYNLLIYVTLGGEYLLSSTYQKFNEKVLKNKVKLVNGYGSTEGGLMAILLPKYQTDDFEAGLCGPLYPGVEIKVSQPSLMITEGYFLLTSGNPPFTLLIPSSQAQ